MSAPVDFNPLAEEYARYRVGYGQEVFAAMARRIDAYSPLGLLDLACGTGLSTSPLAAIAAGPVVGVDVAPGLLKRAPRTADGRGIDYVRGNAVRLPFADRSFQAATCAQALHWMAEAEVLPEVRRVLVPGGWFFAYWKYPAPDEPYQHLANRVLSDVLGRPVESRYALSVPPDLAAGGFEDVTREEFTLALRFTAADYAGFMRSRGRIRDLAKEKTGEFLVRYAELLHRLHPDGAWFEERNLVSLFSGRNP